MNYITGKEALIALANGEKVECFDTRQAFKSLGWFDAKGISVNMFFSDIVKFRLKPRTIMINGIEVPAPFKPKEREQFFILDDSDVKGYVTDFYSKRDYANANFIGMWRTEEEIKQVVEALRSVFK